VRRGLLAGTAAACLAALVCVSAAGQPGAMTITSASRFGRLRRGGVLFPHGLHEAIPSAGCAACHHHGSNERGFPGCGTCHAGKAPLTKAFHRMCIGCHDAAARQGAPAVPRTCAECHPLGGDRRPLGGDRRPLGGDRRPRGGVSTVNP
jgi:hypothetical protein